MARPDHGLLLGLGDDDHPQYQTDTRADARVATHAAITSAHHPKYLDSEAVTAMGVKGDSNALNHDRYLDADAVTAMGVKGDSNDLNHDRYTDGEAAAKVAADALYLGVSAKAADSDLLDNHDTSYFATSSEFDTHDGGTATADHPEATGSVRGFMSAADKTTFDALGVWQAGSAPNLTASTTAPSLTYTINAQRYTRIGDTVHVEGAVVANVVTTVGVGTYRITLPVSANTTITGISIGTFHHYDSSTGIYRQGQVYKISSTLAEFLLEDGTDLPTSPFWNYVDNPITANDAVAWTITYEAA